MMKRTNFEDALSPQRLNHNLDFDDSGTLFKNKL